ncbi:hypothetical protein [Mesorhizobium sp. Z1-4]|uniref:hypothetical protein n=1 Tax=Mesorhizobium sp. Z1-4 TaxID=2448478 RepID=UPI000FD7E954|nr:hypothetical protein [Mesorhizobium sp. Z1-4]
MSWRFTIIVAGLLVLGMTLVAFAQNQSCAPIAHLMQWLAQEYNEFPIFAGQGTQPGQRVIVTRADSGTWTVIAVSGDVACMVASGRQSKMDKGT